MQDNLGVVAEVRQVWLQSLTMTLVTSFASLIY